MTPRHEIVRYSTLSVLEAIRALGAVLVERVAHAAKILRHRRDLEFLAGLDDRMLKDIGLTRSDQESREFRALDRAGARPLGCACHPLAQAGASPGCVKDFLGRSSPRPSRTSASPPKSGCCARRPAGGRFFCQGSEVRIQSNRFLITDF